jgi:hypothetical protein
MWWSTLFRQSFEKLKWQYRRLQGKYYHQKGYFGEDLIPDHLSLHASEKNELLKSITRYLPKDFNFCDYSRV